MTVASELARLTQTIDSASELFLSDQIKMMDVGDGVMRPTNAKAVADLAAQMSGAMIYLSTSLGLEGTVSGGYFSVPSVEEDEYLILYRNNGGVAVEVDRYPNRAAIEKVSSLIQDYSSAAQETEIAVIVDGEGAKHLTLTDKRLQAANFEVTTEAGVTSICDAEGSQVLYADDKRVVLVELEMHRTAAPGIYITDPEGACLELPQPELQPAASPFADGLLFSPVIVTSELHEGRIYSQGLLRRRELATDITMSVHSMTTIANQTGPSVGISAAKYGQDAVLNLRLLANPDSRKFMPLKLRNVPVQPVPSSPKILFIGDSIGDRQGGMYLKQFLQELGFTPQFIGTIEGSASATDVWDITGPLGECHAGWKTGEFTYSVSERAFPVSPGSESTYLAMPKAQRRERNPFLRVATGADDPSVVRNGYVFDPAFYQSRFGLSTPDIVINALGTNDALSFSPASGLYSEVYSNDLLMHKQIRAAWPAAKIIRTLPPSAVSGGANAIWQNSRAVVIQALIDAAANLADSKMTVAPVWAMANPDCAYAYSTGSLGADGFYSGNWVDAVHPVGSGRVEIYQTLAPYLAAAALNII